jgi:1-deoxy-D-xylulose-5-phosphate reductoisomerase
MTAISPAIAILGSTGSIGRAALEVIQSLGPPYRVHGLSAHQRLDELVQQAEACQPATVVAADAQSAERHGWDRLPTGTRLLTGPEGLVELAADPAVGTVIAAIVGRAGLESTLAALDAGKRLALANKEALVVAGPLVARRLRSREQLVPIDSEHSAILQCLAEGDRSVARVILTASGGPFRTWSSAQMASATVEDALAHPTWQMGRKITIDSATMMNKALEVIEARWLFDLSPDKIEVVVHPQSIVHSLVEFVDGSVLAQLSPPDMRLPIQYALTCPERTAGPAQRMDWRKAYDLRLEPVDRDRFPALDLGFEVARAGGTTGAVLNAANEAAVALFLSGVLRLTEIVPACRAALSAHQFDANPNLSTLLACDRWARAEVHRWSARCSMS